MRYARRQFGFGVLTSLAFAGLPLVKKLIALPDGARACDPGRSVPMTTSDKSGH
jgi:hypothetical protein